MITNEKSKELSNERPFLRNNWNSIENAVISSQPTAHPPLKIKEHQTTHKPKNLDSDNELLVDEGKTDSVQEDMSERSEFFLIQLTFDIYKQIKNYYFEPVFHSI